MRFKKALIASLTAAALTLAGGIVAAPAIAEGESNPSLTVEPNSVCRNEPFDIDASGLVPESDYRVDVDGRTGQVPFIRYSGPNGIIKWNEFYFHNYHTPGPKTISLYDRHGNEVASTTIELRDCDLSENFELHASPSTVCFGDELEAYATGLHPKWTGWISIGNSRLRGIESYDAGKSNVVRWRFDPKMAPGTYGLHIVSSWKDIGTDDYLSTVYFNLENCFNPSYLAYADVQRHRVFADEIAFVTMKEITKGWDLDDGTSIFKPLSRVLRDQMAAFLFRMAAAIDPTVNDFEAPPVSPFKDVGTNHIFYREIAWMHHMGISKGWPVASGGHEFRPYAPVLRDQMAAFMFRLGVHLDPVWESWTANYNFPAFQDVGKDHIFYAPIYWMWEWGISKGWEQPDGKPKYLPYAPVLRDQMAAFLVRFYDMFIWQKKS